VALPASIRENPVSVDEFLQAKCIAVGNLVSFSISCGFGFRSARFSSSGPSIRVIGVLNSCEIFEKKSRLRSVDLSQGFRSLSLRFVGICCGDSAAQMSSDQA